jgi:predicted alpha/beta superfamily hydrolase
MSKKYLGPILVILVCFSLLVYAQETKVASVVHDLHIIKSKILNEDRSVLVQLPASYGQTYRKFPVVYMLDGHASFLSLMPGMLEHLAWSGHIPEMILVSIQNTDRTRDLSPTKVAARPTSGGGDNFLQFIETEVMPLVEKNYRTQPFRIFAGHSLGGLAVVYAMVSRPDLFQAYIAASPVLHWDNNFVIKRAEEAFKQRKDWKKTIFLAVGDEPPYFSGFNAFKDLLGKAKPNGLVYEFRRMPEENHGSAALQAYYWGLRKIYDGWLPPSSGDIADLENHYRRLSEKYGYQILIPETLLNQIGYHMLGTNNYAAAIKVFQKNVELYPDSSNVYDSLAEAYDRDGQSAAARRNYEKAVSVAEKSGNAELVQTHQRNLEKFKSKKK